MSIRCVLHRSPSGQHCGLKSPVLHHPRVKDTDALPSAGLPLTRRYAGVEPFKHVSTSGSGDSGDAVVVGGVQRAARAVDGQRVMILSHEPADDAHQDLPVLVPQQAVDKRVAGGLAVGQTFGGDAPVPGDVHRGDQLQQPAGGVQAEEVHLKGNHTKCGRPFLQIN